MRWTGRILLAAHVVLIAWLVLVFDPATAAAQHPSDSRGGTVERSAVTGRDAVDGVRAPGNGNASTQPAVDARHAEPVPHEHARPHGEGASWGRARLTRWSKARATWYGPGFYGNRTACGQRYTIRIRGVAVPSGGRYHLRCGHRLTICHAPRRRCVRVRVIDTGSFRGHRFDLSARTAMDLCRCWRPYTMRVRWHHGWKARA